MTVPVFVADLPPRAARLARAKGLVNPNGSDTVDMDAHPTQGGFRIYTRGKYVYPALVRIRNKWFVADEPAREQDAGDLGDFPVAVWDIIMFDDDYPNRSDRYDNPFVVAARAIIDEVVDQFDHARGFDLEANERRGIAMRAKFAVVHIWKIWKRSEDERRNSSTSAG